MLVHESSTIIRALDADNFDQIVIDKSSSTFGGFGGGFGGNSRKDRMAKEKSLISSWRKLARHPKVENVLMDIWNEGVSSDSRTPVSVDVSQIVTMNEKITEKLKDEVQVSFANVMRLLSFRKNGTKIFKEWYVDGRLYVYYELKKTEGGAFTIGESRILDPMKLKLISKGNKQYYEYETDEPVIVGKNTLKTIKLPYARVLFVPSGLKSDDGIWLSYLNKALRPMNLLQLLENSLVIHRFVRSPERWVFKVDVSNMNKKRAKAYIQNMISKYRSKYQIDPTTGEMSNTNTIMSMQENVYIPKTNSSNGGHEIDTIGGNSSYGDIDDILYWKEEVSQSLNSSQTKDGDSMFNFGSRIEEISRAEYKWYKFIKWLRSYFNSLFLKLVAVDIVARKVMSKSEFSEIEDMIYFIYDNDSIYEEAKRSQKIEMKLDALDKYGALAEEWYGEEWVRENILQQTPDDIKKYMAHRAEHKANNTDDDKGNKW